MRGCGHQLAESAAFKAFVGNLPGMIDKRIAVPPFPAVILFKINEFVEIAGSDVDCSLDAVERLGSKPCVGDRFRELTTGVECAG